MKKKKILYWSPHLTHIGTINSVLNSVKALRTYSNTDNEIDIQVINLFGEWSNHKVLLGQINATLVNFFNPKINKFIPRNSFLKSRFSYLLFFFLSIFKLKNFLQLNKSSIMIIHLLTSLPILVVSFFDLDIKLVLRISGRVRKNFVRNVIWRIGKKKIKYVTCPSEETRNEIMKLNIFDENKVITLYDPVIEPKKINKLKRDKIENNNFLEKKYILGVGRLTNQKNFLELIESFEVISKKNPEYLLIILGEGEERNKLTNRIKSLKLENKVFLLGFEQNVYKYLYHANVFISSSKYEDPGASIIQAIYCNRFVISSNCKNGPSEILNSGKGGILYDPVNGSIEESFEKFLKINEVTKKKYIINAKKNILKYSLFRHYKALIKIINKV